MSKALLNLIGTGERTNPLCGDNTIFTVVCPEDESHYKKGILSDCHSWMCPDCYKLHVRKEADAAFEYLSNVKREYYVQGIDLGLPVHLILSPDPAAVGDLSQLTADRYRELEATARKHAERIGCIGGTIITHNVVGDSKTIRNHRLYGTPIKHQLHFHFIAFMPNGFLMKSNDFHQLTIRKGERWIYKTIPLRVPKFGVVKNILRYELSHAAVPVYSRYTGHIIRYIGCCSRNNVKVELSVVKEPVLCPVCGRQLHLDREGDDLGEYFRKVKYRRFLIKPDTVRRIAEKYHLTVGQARPETITGWGAMA